MAVVQKHIGTRFCCGVPRCRVAVVVCFPFALVALGYLALSLRGEDAHTRIVQALRARHAHDLSALLQQLQRADEDTDGPSRRRPVQQQQHPEQSDSARVHEELQQCRAQQQQQLAEPERPRIDTYGWVTTANGAARYFDETVKLAYSLKSLPDSEKRLRKVAIVTDDVLGALAESSTYVLDNGTEVPLFDTVVKMNATAYLRGDVDQRFCGGRLGTIDETMFRRGIATYKIAAFFKAVELFDAAFVSDGDLFVANPAVASVFDALHAPWHFDMVVPTFDPQRHWNVMTQYNIGWIAMATKARAVVPFLCDWAHAHFSENTEDAIFSADQNHFVFQSWRPRWRPNVPTLRVYGPVGPEYQCRAGQLSSFVSEPHGDPQYRRPCAVLHWHNIEACVRTVHAPRVRGASVEWPRCTDATFTRKLTQDCHHMRLHDEHRYPICAFL